MTKNHKTRMIVIALTLAAIFLGTPLLAAETDYTDKTTGMEFALVKGGKFIMGDITGRDKTAAPAHRVTVKDFYIGKYEVTFEQYDKYCIEAGRIIPFDNNWGRGTRPVINVSWEDATSFAKWLSSKSGKSFRLPTEAEWEYAARGGKGSRFWWGNEHGSNLANCFDCGSEWSGKSTSPVGSFAANPFGLYDMNGNVYEWCLDTIHRNYVGAPIDGSAWIDNKATKYISRSGAWYMPHDDMSSFARSWDQVDTRNNTIGIRLVMEP